MRILALGWSQASVSPPVNFGSGPRAAKLGDNVTSIDAFTKFAIAADQTFTACRNELDSRLVHSYPKNCCELISVHLGLALETVNPGSNVEVVRAYNHNANKWHYWVEMDGVVFDLTAHQFDEYRQPLVCAKPSPFESRFPDIERISSSDAERAGPFTVNPKFMCIFSDCYQLASSTSLRE